MSLSPVLWQQGPLGTDPIVDFNERHWNGWKYDHKGFKQGFFLLMTYDSSDFKTICE